LRARGAVISFVATVPAATAASRRAAHAGRVAREDEVRDRGIGREREARGGGRGEAADGKGFLRKLAHAGRAPIDEEAERGAARWTAGTAARRARADGQPGGAETLRQVINASDRPPRMSAWKAQSRPAASVTRSPMRAGAASNR
jgi:hypothetical protein